MFKGENLGARRVIYIFFSSVSKVHMLCYAPMPDSNDGDG